MTDRLSLLLGVIYYSIKPIAKILKETKRIMRNSIFSYVPKCKFLDEQLIRILNYKVLHFAVMNKR